MSLGLPLVDIPVDDENSVYSIPPLALLIKHHPQLANVEPTEPLWSSGNNNDNSDRQNRMISLRATKDILPGQELFLEFDQHPARVMPDFFRNTVRIPTLNEYKEADEIILEERIAFTKVNNIINKKRSNEVGLGLRMTQKAVARYQPVVAALLPIMADPLVQYRHKSTVTNSLQNQTMDSLMEYGICASDYDTVRGTVRRPTKEGRRVMPVPLYVTTETGEQCSEDGSCSSSSSSSSSTMKKGCLYRTDSALVLCPLVDVEYAVAASDEEGTAANVKFQWSSWNPINATGKVPSAVLEVRQSQ
jgi:hypothetical protein